MADRIGPNGVHASKEHCRVAVIVLAAGLSTRFGGGKPLAPFGDRTLLEETLGRLQASRVSEIVLVLGHRAEEILDRVQIGGIRTVLNSRFHEGMSASIKAGLTAMRGDEDAVLIALADQPLVLPRTIDRLLQAYEASGAPAVVPTYHGKRGNPILLDLCLRPRMEALKGDIGCRELLRSLEALQTVEVDDPGILVDVDTPEDLAQAKEKADAAVRVHAR